MPARAKESRVWSPARRIATRFERLAVNYTAMLKVAMMQRYLIVLFLDRA